jgi:hypothetical protein
MGSGVASRQIFIVAAAEAQLIRLIANEHHAMQAHTGPRLLQTTKEQCTASSGTPHLRM